MLALGIDIGGTFTDFVLYDRDRRVMREAKLPSVPGRQWEALAGGLAALGVAASELSVVVHGTTVATNALLEHKGVPVALVTTAGFRDMLEIGRCMRLQPGSLFQTHFKRPKPLVPRDRRLEIHERVAADGSVVAAIDEHELALLVAAIAAIGVPSVAVCLLNAYANPAHERQIGAALEASRFSGAVYLSQEVSPEYREYERLTTTLINATVSPILDDYLQKFDAVLRDSGFAGQLLVMSSNGGTIGRALAGRMGAQSILSGPVGGIRGAAAAAGPAARVITLDIGGTSTDVALLDGAEPRMAQTREVGGYPLRLPQLDISTIGAGGGSLARVDEGGAVLVGPQSAGADPGPACYGRGTTQPTVTDANLVLGRLGERLLGGALALDHGLAMAAIARLAERAGMAPLALAEGIIDIAVAHMANAIREVSVQQGADPRDFALVAFGGAGPLHACLVAAELGMRTVLVPPAPGNTCAYGLLASALRRDAAQTWLRRLGGLPRGEIRAVLEKLAGELTASLEPGWPVPAITHALDLRYVGQAFEVTLALPDLSDSTLAALPDLFGARHAAIYGHRHDRDVEVVTLRVVARSPAPADFSLPEFCAATETPAVLRRVYHGGWRDCAVLQRGGLAAGRTLPGPAIIEETGSTTWLPAGWTLAVERNGTLRLEHG